MSPPRRRTTSATRPTFRRRPGSPRCPCYFPPHSRQHPNTASPPAHADTPPRRPNPLARSTSARVKYTPISLPRRRDRLSSQQVIPDRVELPACVAVENVLQRRLAVQIRKRRH